MNPDRAAVKEEVLRIAREAVAKGAGYAQEGYVLREARKELGPTTLRDEQLILDCWHELFRAGSIAWGYNLDNSGAPFFHLAADEAAVRS